MSSCNENVLSSFCLPDNEMVLSKDTKIPFTSVEVLGEGHGALVEAVPELHPYPELDQVRHLDKIR